MKKSRSAARAAVSKPQAKGQRRRKRKRYSPTERRRILSAAQPRSLTAAQVQSEFGVTPRSRTTSGIRLVLDEGKM